ncbi:MAG TPA: hypothetical protein VMD55_11620 [Terracidiphilus sp.]|jgi:hypothetical protein|nr:hypothetical protein [Terracidiphilus sp.]
MHIHGMNPQSAYLDSLANSERAGAAARAEETRKKLLRSAQSIAGHAASGASEADGAQWASQWQSAQNNEGLAGDEYHPSVPGKDPDFG